MTDFIPAFLWAYISHWEGGTLLNPYFVWMLLEIVLFILLFLVTKKYSTSSFGIFFGMIFEKVYEFFEDILGKEEKKWTKLYITSMFFVILVSNLIGVVVEIIGVWLPSLHHLIHIPTSDVNFNIAMAIIWVVIVIYEQFAFLWFGKALYEYAPFLWKDYIPYEKWKLNKYIDIPLFLLVKFFDIVISMFLWVLEIVWHWAKIISLSFRLFWNITSWWLLLGMLLVWLSSLSNFLVWFDFPVIVPVLLHLQWLLVALIQALVFPLLIAIFIKVAKVH